MSRRDAILIAAQRALNADPTCSMAEIAAEAGIGRATLHRTFASREALLTELGTRSLNRWRERLDAADVEAVAGTGDAGRITEVLAGLLRDYVADSDDFGFALTDQVILADATLKQASVVLADRELVLIAAAQECGVLARELTPRWISHMLWGVLVAAREAVFSGDVGRRDAPDLVVTTFFSGVGAR